MVKLSAVTVEESAEADRTVDEAASYEIAGSQQVISGIPHRPIKIRLTKNLIIEVDDDRYADGANIDAWLDLRDDSVFCWEESWDDPYYLEAEEFESLEDPKETGEAGEVVASVEASTIVQATPGTWEAEALEKIKFANTNVAMMEGRHLEAKERAKDCKADWESAVNRLTELIEELTRPLPLFDRPPVKQETPADTPDPTDPSDPTDESWRATPIDEIFLGIRGLGAKKKEAIQDAIPTLGAFEDLRKKASLAGDPLREHMPKGVGQDACDQLEEAAMNAISRIMTFADDENEYEEDGSSDNDEIE